MIICGHLLLLRSIGDAKGKVFILNPGSPASVRIIGSLPLADDTDL
jgi:hypothetical protein